MSDTTFILIVENQAERAEALAGDLKQKGHLCSIAPSLNEALQSIRTRRPDVILASGELATEDESKFLAESALLAPDAELVVLGDGTGLDDATVSRLPDDADGEAVSRAVHEAARRARDKRDLRAVQEQADRLVEFEGLITVNETMIQLIHKLRKVANSKLTVLILGESGTGKELLARAIHHHSPRKDKPYRAVNCAGFNENLLESELFGHVKGSFTGALSDRKGLFEIVDGGTLFLDEVGDMPMPMQAKLLRTLENSEILPVGGTDIRKVDVRVVAATRQDIRAMVEEGTFRDDLYYRLNQASLRVPPLRERRGDIPFLVQYFLDRAAAEHDRPVRSASAEVVRRLSGHQWPGNVRELRNVIDSMVVLTEGNILDVDDLPDPIRSSGDIVLASTPNLAGLTMEQMQKLHIASTLKLTNGNREKAAKMLGIGARTLYRKLREYGLQ